LSHWTPKDRLPLWVTLYFWNWTVTGLDVHVGNNKTCLAIYCQCDRDTVFTLCQYRRASCSWHNRNAAF
jgi:hypothetical protein